MSTPAQRQAKILEWLGAEGSVRLSELATRLGVSQMTVHRDTAALAQRGAAVKTHGAVQLPAVASRTLRLCPVCATPIVDRLRFSFTSGQDGRQREVCCGHCALLLAKGQELTTLLATDYLYGRVMNAGEATYVLASRVTACCKPSVLPFLTGEDARDFAKAFGGEVLALEELRERLG